MTFLRTRLALLWLSFRRMRLNWAMRVMQKEHELVIADLLKTVRISHDHELREDCWCNPIVPDDVPVVIHRHHPTH